MMKQILVTGMHRSGTTLCFDLLRRHPEVENEINESVVFDQATGELMSPPFYSNAVETGGRRSPGARAGRKVKVDFDQNSMKCSWLAKMSYPGPVILQEWCRPAGDYVAAWLKTFGESARVLHMVRHPFAVFGSVRRRWGADPVHLTNYGPISLDSICRDWAISVGGLDNAFGNDERLLTIRYEDLVSESDRYLELALKHCALSADGDQVARILKEKIAFFGKVDESRAQAHREVALEPISRSTSWMMTPLFRKWGYFDLD